MPRDKLVPWLEKRELTGTKGCFGERYITTKILDTLYTRMDALNASSKSQSGGNRV